MIIYILYIHKKLSIGRLLLNIFKKDKQAFNKTLLDTRLDTMISLSTSMESYSRAYPYLIQLHVLSEIEEGFDFVSQLDKDRDGSGDQLIPSKGSENIQMSSRKGKNSSIRINTQAGHTKDQSSSSSRVISFMSKWDSRLDILPPSLSQRSFVMAVRRSIFTIAGHSELVAKIWYDLCDLIQKSGNFLFAQITLRNAELSGLSRNQSLLQECLILSKSGHTNKALSLLEPIEIDVFALRRIFKSSKNSQSMFTNIQERHDLANQLLLATKWMVESRQKQGKTIVERYKAVLALRPNWEDAFFELGRYLEYLYEDAKSKELARETFRTRGSSKSSKSSSFQNIGDSDIISTYLHQTIELYSKAVLSGTKYIGQTLPRMLTLWFSNTTPEAPLISRTTCERIQDRMRKTGEKVPASILYTCISQLVSRAQHPNSETSKLINQTFLSKILYAFPHHGIWHVAGMMYSLNTDRQSIGKSILKEVGIAFYKETGKNSTRELFEDCLKLFRNLIELAAHDTKEKKLNWKIGESCNLSRMIVPTKSALHINLPDSTHSEGGDEMDSNFVYFPTDQLFIKSFKEVVEVAASKARPKIISLLTVCGKTIKFLCKQEKNGDLRKDAHMMEFNCIINRLLQEDSDARKRCLRLRTFSVTCLNEECGILEWVNNTNTLRNLIFESHSYLPEVYPIIQAKDVMEELKRIQEIYFSDLDQLVLKYNELVLTKYRPYLHRWFFEKYSDPSEWLEARTSFTHSSAIWSIVGHIIGLGDRHTENILVDTFNGELVHVDFDCLFDKGLTLARPEIVPFRLTPNIVDAMGVCGIEGGYRKSMEVSLKLLRSNKDILLSILEPFLRDPTVAWGRAGRAQQLKISSFTSNSKHTRPTTEHDNADAKEALFKISKRLDGVYNIFHPKAHEISNVYISKNMTIPNRGIGALEEEELPLSVAGQAQRLIEEAADEVNLAQMYFGWTPWL